MVAAWSELYRGQEVQLIPRNLPPRRLVQHYSHLVALQWTFDEIVRWFPRWPQFDLPLLLLTLHPSPSAYSNSLLSLDLWLFSCSLLTKFALARAARLNFFPMISLHYWVCSFSAGYFCGWMRFGRPFQPKSWIVLQSPGQHLLELFRSCFSDNLVDLLVWWPQFLFHRFWPLSRY